VLCLNNKLYALGFRVNNDQGKFNGLAAEEKEQKPVMQDPDRDVNNIQNHKKILHCYSLNEQEFTEIHEGVFTAGARKASMDLEDQL